MDKILIIFDNTCYYRKKTIHQRFINIPNSIMNMNPDYVLRATHGNGETCFVLFSDNNKYREPYIEEKTPRELGIWIGRDRKNCRYDYLLETKRNPFITPKIKIISSYNKTSSPKERCNNFYDLTLSEEQQLWEGILESIVKE